MLRTRKMPWLSHEGLHEQSSMQMVWLNPARSSQSKFQETIVPRVSLVPPRYRQSAKHNISTNSRIGTFADAGIRIFVGHMWPLFGVVNCPRHSARVCPLIFQQWCFQFRVFTLYPLLFSTFKNQPETQRNFHSARVCPLISLDFPE